MDSTGACYRIFELFLKMKDKVLIRLSRRHCRDLESCNTVSAVLQQNFRTIFQDCFRTVHGK